MEIQLHMPIVKAWYVRSIGKHGHEEMIIAIKDFGPVLHGRRDSGEEVTFSPAHVVRFLL